MKIKVPGLKVSYIKNIFYLILLLPVVTFSQSISVEIDTNSILIGEQTNLRLSVNYRVDDGEYILSFPEVKEELGEGVEVVYKSKVDTSIVDKDDPYLFSQTQEITITSFDVGVYQLPAFVMVFNGDSIKSPSIDFTVRDVEVAQDEQLAVIKGPLEDQITLLDWVIENWMYVLFPLLGVLLIVGLVYFLLSNRSKEIVEKPEPVIPAHIIALEKLNLLQTKGLWQEGKYKQYHSELTDAIREYLERRFAIQALEQTSDEIFVSLRLKPITEENREKLRFILTLADLVKFAKEVPLGEENEQSLSQAIAFVEATKLIETEKDEVV